MAGGEQLAQPRVSRVARLAGLHRRAPTFSDVDRRRVELWIVSLVLVTIGGAAVALLALGRPILPESIRSLDLPTELFVLLIAGLGVAFLLYVLEKERSLRRLSADLVEERVRSEALSNRVTEVSRLSQVGRAVNGTLDPQRVFEMILSSALELLDGTEGAVLLLNEDRSALEVTSFRGSPPPGAADGRLPLNGGLAADVLSSHRPKLFQADRSDGHVTWEMSVPLVRQGEILGALNIGNERAVRRIKEGDLNALGLFGEHAAMAIGNARLFEKERETVVRLEEIDRLKSDFVAIVSHELRSPLTAIIGAARTVARKGPILDAAQHEGFMDMIHRQAQRMLRLAEDFLTASSIEAGSRSMRREHVDLEELTERVIDDLGHSSVGSNRTIVLDCDTGSPGLWGDRAAIEQILSNLIENALKYSEEWAEVEVKLKASVAETVIEVADHGDGIPADLLDTIFDRFHQAEPSTTSAEGVGLGLFIVKNLVDAHSGSIEVRSEVGSGTTFAVHLPQRSPDR